jgi:hypothetical protein
VNSLLRCVITLGPPLLFQVLLKIDQPPLLLYGYLGLGCILPLFHPFQRKAFFFLYGLLGAVIAIVLILVFPYSAYVIWLELLKKGVPTGSVSYTFFFIEGYLAMTSGWAFQSGNWKTAILHFLAGQSVVLFIILGFWILGILVWILFMTLSIARLRLEIKGRIEWRGIAWIGGMVAFAWILGFGFTRSFQPQGVPFFDTFLSDFIRKTVSTMFPRFPILLGVPGYGYGFAPDRWGDRPYLSERPVFSLRIDQGIGTRPLYLRTLIYDLFTPKGWIQRAEWVPFEDHHNLAPRQIELEEPERITLTVETDYYPYLPHELATKSIKIDRPEAERGGIGNWDTGIKLSKPLLKGERVELHYERQTRGGSSQEGYTDLLWQEDRVRYLQVPLEMRGILSEKFEFLLGLPEESFLEALGQIFREDYTYTLVVMGSGSLLQTFLENKAGYCVHFATAATLVARLRGIPARYVTGFLYYPLSFEDTPTASSVSPERVITGLNAHAWVELWLPGKGWVTFEPTPPFREEANLLGAERIQQDPYTQRQLRSIVGDRLLRDSQGGAGSRETVWIEGIFPWAVGVVVSIGVCLVILRFARTIQLPLWVLSGRKARWVKEFTWLAKRCVEIATRRFGVLPPERIGWLQWEVSLLMVWERTYHAGGNPDFSLFRRVFFGGTLPTQGEVSLVRELLRRLKRVSKENH